MRKFLILCVWILCAAVIFFAGFYIGTLDTNENKVVITSQCTGIGVERSFSANYERVGDEVIKDEQAQSEQYTTRCLCFASNAEHENLWVDTVEFAGNSQQEVTAKCNADCQKVCEERLSYFTFDE